MKLKSALLFHTPKAAIICYGLAVSSVFAQSAATPSEPEKETADSTTMPSMVVTASPIIYQAEDSTAALFNNVPLIETPFSVSVFTEELIEDQRAFTLSEVLENDPSIALQMPGGYYATQNLGLRGFRVDNFNGYRVDGLPFIQTVSPMIDDKARVEVLKGPAGLRYGFMSPGGAINLVSKRPTPELTASLSVDVNTFGNVYSQLDVGDTVGTFGYRLVLGGEEYNSFYDNADGDRAFGSLMTDWQATENLRLWAGVSLQDFERNGYYGPAITSSGKVLNTGVKTNIMQDWAKTEQHIFDVSTGAEVTFNEDWKLLGSVNYQDSERTSQLTYPYGVEDNGDFTEGGFLNDDPSTWEAWGFHSHVEGAFETGSLGHELVVGGQYRTYDSYTDRSFPDVGPNNVFNLQRLAKPAIGGVDRFDYDYEEFGFFLTDTVEFNDCWSTLLGVRYSDIDTKSHYSLQRGPNLITGTEDYGQDAWTPTVALMYAPYENIHSYVTYTRGLQDGGLYEDVNANPVNLGPQESEQWEIGLKTEWCDGRYSSEIALFQIEQDLPVQTANSWAYSGLQRHRGIEFSLGGKFTDELQAGVSAMLLDAKQVDTGDPAINDLRPQYVPEYQVNLWSVLDIPQVPGLSLTANARFVDKQYLDQGEQVSTDAYSVVDVGARYRFQTSNADWTVRLLVENVLDERYFESGEVYDLGTAYGGGAMAYGAPVSATLSLQVTF